MAMNEVGRRSLRVVQVPTLLVSPGFKTQRMKVDLYLLYIYRIGASKQM
jgi:hypothetical protein